MQDEEVSERWNCCLGRRTTSNLAFPSGWREVVGWLKGTTKLCGATPDKARFVR